MNFIIENWQVIVMIVVLIVVLGMAAYKFFTQPSNKQMEQVREWLLFATLEAEKQFKSGTGQVKLRFVYDMFITRFPVVAKMITFTTFSILVDQALNEMRVLLGKNKAIEEIILPKETFR